MNTNLEEERKLAVLGVARSSSQVVEKVSEALQLLLQKRQTLEEKMLSTYFIAVGECHASILGSLFSCLLNPNGPQVESKIIVTLTEVTEDALCSLSNFLKAAMYDLNYLEQYFEHDFYAELLHSKLKERTEEAVNKIRDSSQAL
jgi:hypothetical protein